MTKVLFLARLFSPHIGGVEAHVLNVAKELQKNGYHITVITEQFDLHLNDLQTVEGIEVIRIPKDSLRNKVTLWKWIWSHRELFNQADVVHVHDVFWWVVPVLPLIKSKYFITFHGWEGSFPIKRTAVLQRQAAAKLAKGVIQVGEYIEKWYGTNADIVTFGGADAMNSEPNRAQHVLSKVFDAARKGTFSTKEKKKYSAVFVGRLSADNDIEKVVEFFRIWREKYSVSKFLFLGDGEYRQLCETVGEVKGFVKYVSKEINETNIVCANSYLSILEAQALGKLVVSFYSNPLKKEYLSTYPGAKAMIIAESPEMALVELQEFFKHPRELNEKISEVRSWARSQTWQKVAQSYEELWSKT